MQKRKRLSLEAMEVICLQTEALHYLVEQVVDRLGEKMDKKEDKWIQIDEAMRLLGVKSKTTLQKLRNEGSIRFTQPEKKIILYDRESIMEYLEKHARETF